ncbi:MAG: hypothetical protein H0W86_07035 [Armatimonadetes bacterium]|nr:hypothetical protein [Armatimonadota bacterium]
MDVGSNSVLLLVAELRDGEWKAIYETSEVTALGEHTKETGVLGEAGMAATLAALKRALEHSRERGAEARAFGTMALRLAGNADEFRRRAAEQGTPAEVLSGDDEAELGLASVIEDPLFRDRVRMTIVDVGGHSTEIATKDSSVSYAVGTLGLRSGILAEESPGPAAILTASTEIDREFAEHRAADKGGTVVALGATGTNLVTIREAMLEWDPDRVHGQYLDFEEVSRFVGHSMRLSDAGRAAIPGIERGRERTIHVGALILERALHLLSAEGCFVSARGWRHAILSRL